MINISGPINQLGYGITCLNIIKSLSKLTNVCFFPIGNPQVTSQEDADIVRFCIDKAKMLDFNAPSIKIWHQHDMTQFPVEDKNGNIEYYLEPAIQEQAVEFLPLEKISKDISLWEKKVSETAIDPACIKKKEIYVDSRGNVFPCCWIGSDWVEQPIKESLPIQKLRNLVVQDTKLKFKDLGVPNLSFNSVYDLPWNDLNNELQRLKPWTCVKNCNGRK